MTLKTNWKTWSIPLCLTVSMTASPASAADFLTLEAPVQASISDEEVDGELVPVPLDEGEMPQALEPAPLDEEATADVALTEEEPVAETTEEPETEEAVTEEPATEAAPAPAANDQTSEVIEERYPNGALKIVREVVQDAQGNYLNHGTWKMLSEKGLVQVEGQFYEDARHGVWNRWYAAGEVAFLRQKPFTEFTPPFVSQGIFDTGELHGAWIIYDAKQRKICEIRFNHGERDGLAAWWHPNGRKMREMKYEKGVVHGDVLEWAADGTLAKKDVFDQGRKHTTQTVHHGGDVKKFSGQFLEPELQAKQLDDWWKGEMATYASTGKPIKHGGYAAWHPNGQMRMKGEYKYDMPVGTFTWWYANGQKSLEGDYIDGKQEGEWSWWHENGQRSIRGFFATGNPEGKWTWWNKEGKVAQSGDFSDDKGQIVVTPVTPAPAEQAQTPQRALKPARR